jgi:hypothetical protein
MPPPTESERELDQLAAELRRLENEYSKFFAGRSPRPPLELRAHVDRLFKTWDRRQGDSSAARFRLQTLQSRYSTFVELWERAMRQREEGRPGPAGRRDAPAPSDAPTPKLRDETFSTVVRDPASQQDQVRSLYEAAMSARQATGHEIVPYAQFEALVVRQVAALKQKGAADVVFRVSITGGRPNLTARATRPAKGRGTADSERRGGEDEGE